MSARRVTTTVTLLVLVGVLVVGAVIGWQTFTSGFSSDEPSASPSPTCDPDGLSAGDRLRAQQVRVSVFNAGDKSGQAGDVRGLLKKRGFDAGDVGNAPSGTHVRKVVVWSTSANDARARLVARQFGKHTKIKKVDELLGKGVNVVVGNRFHHLHHAPQRVRVHAAEATGC